MLQDTEQRIHLLMEVLDYPVVSVPTPDRRFFWVMDKHGSGGIYDLKTGRLAASCPKERSWTLRFLARDGTLRTVPEEDVEEAQYDLQDRCAELSEVYAVLSQPAAIGTVSGENGKPSFVTCREGITPAGVQIDFPFSASAFDASAERLAVVDLNGVVILRVADDAVLATLPHDSGRPGSS